jgi:serine/threonine protein kinase
MANIILGDYSYNEKDKLGEGAQAAVYKGINLKNNTPVAIKIYFKGEDTDVVEEIDNLRKLYEDGDTSPYVTQYYTDFELDNKRIIVTEYVEGLQLSSFISFEHYKNPIAFWRLIYQLLKGLQFIHSKGLAHKDIGMNNILLTDNNIVKYIDFGMSCVKKCPKVNKNCKNVCTTFGYYAGKYEIKIIDTSLSQNQTIDIFHLIDIVQQLFNQRETYFKFIRETFITNNTCNLSEVKDDKSQVLFVMKDFLTEVIKFYYNSSPDPIGINRIYIYDTVDKVLDLLNNLILSPLLEGKQVTLKELTGLLPESEINLGNYFFNKKDVLVIETESGNAYNTIYLGYDRRDNSKVLVKYMYYQTWDGSGYEKAIQEINAYEKLYEDDKTSKFVAKYYDTFLSETGLYLITEYIENGNLKGLRLIPFPMLRFIMYQLLLGLKFIHNKGLILDEINLKDITLTGDIILTGDNIIKYTNFENSCLIECPKSNANCTNVCKENFVVTNRRSNCSNLYFILKTLFEKGQVIGVEEYMTRAQSFIYEIKEIVKDEKEEDTLDAMLASFEKNLIRPFEDKKITLEGYIPIVIEEVIDYIIDTLYEGQEITGIAENYLEDLESLRKYYSLIDRMCINTQKLIIFNKILKESLINKKEEQFTNFPSKDIFVEFYALFNKILDDLSDEWR